MELSDRLKSVAKAVHEINRIYCEALGDYSQPRWEDAPDWQVDATYKQIDSIELNPRMTPRDSHEVWMSTKKEDGWVYGEEKNAEKKTHPCLVPYEQLPIAQRAKDEMYNAVVRGLLNIG